MAFPVTLNGRTYTLTDFEGTNYVDGLPDAFEDFVTHAGDIYNSTSTTSNSIGTGSKTFTVEANKPYQAGTPLRIADAAAPSTNFLDTVVTSYSGTTLVVNSIGFGGSGTKTSWTVNIGGAKTVDGTLGLSQGGTGATDAAGARTNIDVYSKADADSRFLNVSGEASDVVLNGDLTVDTDTLYVDSTNDRVGINKNAPSVPLHIDIGTDNNAIYIESSDQFANIGLVDGGGSGKIIMDGGDLLITSGGDATTSFTGSAEAMRVDSSQRLLKGYTSSVQINGRTADTQFSGTGTPGGSISIARYNNGAGGPYVTLGHSRGANGTPGTIVAEDDNLGSITFAGDDGADFNTQGAYITAAVDGTPGANDMPTRLVFGTTPDGSNSTVERMRINRSGEIIATGGGTGYGGFIIQPGANGKVTTGMVSGSSTQSFVTFNLSSAFVSMTAIEFTVMQRRNASGGYNQIDNGKFGIFVSNRNDTNSAWKVELLTYGSSYSSATISDSYANKTVTVTLTSAHSLTTSPDITLVTASRSLYG